MRDRLIELIKESGVFGKSGCHYNDINYFSNDLADYLIANGVIVPLTNTTDHPTEKVCTGKRCPMQVGYDVSNCKHKECIYRTETEKDGVE